MPKFAVIALVFLCVVVGQRSYGDEAGTLGAMSPWCNINPPSGPGSTPRGKFTRVGINELHVVQPAKQIEAQRRLAAVAFAPISRKDALDLAESPYSPPSSDHNYYVVRASAFGMDANYRMAGQMSAVIYLTERLLQIYTEGLGGPEAHPKNLAVVLATDIEIAQADAICLIAQ